MPLHGSSYFPSKAPSSYTAAAWLEELLFSKHRWMLIRVVTQAVLKGTEVPSFWGNVRPQRSVRGHQKCFHPGKKADLEQGARCGKADCRQEGRFRQWNGDKAGLCHRDAAVGQTRSSRASHGSQPPWQTDWHTRASDRRQASSDTTAWTHVREGSDLSRRERSPRVQHSVRLLRPPPRGPALPRLLPPSGGSGRHFTGGVPGPLPLGTDSWTDRPHSTAAGQRWTLSWKPKSAVAGGGQAERERSRPQRWLLLPDHDVGYREQEPVPNASTVLSLSAAFFFLLN